MKRVFAVVALAFLICIPAHAAPKVTGLPFAQSAPQIGGSHDGHPVDMTFSKISTNETYPVVMVLKAEAPIGACPGSAVHCIISTWTASSDGATSPSLAYNFYIWPVGATPPTCTNGNPCTGVAPVNAAPTAAGCSAACGFTDTAVGPGKFNIAVTAVLNGSESVLSNVIAITIAPAAPVLNGSGQ